ncbi:hypothetical protein [Sedimenticola hydrogenitrophicus]|uniref:hypothetical protein n=1 Tax=Sedimenticola hydrogenitrophicus TaxID=2967975 RepID=UPI0021A58138|nr:hypothetical protein [Sedimenticola hydrogenitrophicus]
MVVGFLVLGGLIIYLILTLILVWLGIRVARERGKSGWKGAVPVLVVMYLLMFWDLIPMQMAHRYYCATEGGFSLNKSLEQWQAENPGVAKTLKPLKNAPQVESGNRVRVALNQRFAWDTYTTREFLEIRKRDERIIDIKTGEVLARNVDFDDGLHSRNPKRFRDFKLWLWTGACPGEVGDPKWVVDGDSFISFQTKIERINGVMK